MDMEAFAPLQGQRVLELAQNLAGPYCSQILHDLGADVVKIEPPDGGDPARRWGPPFIGDVGSIFAATNRGKRSIVLDLRAAPDRDALWRLIDDCDVLVEALRPGAFDRFGFGYDAVHARKQSLIYCSVLAYGEHGPLRTLPGYDPLMQAHAGIMSTTGEPQGAPSRVGTSVVDMGTGMWLAIGVLAALRERAVTGNGRRVTVALYDTALAWNTYHLIGYAASGFVPTRMGTELPMIAPYGAFAARDGQLMIAAANDNLFRRLCTALGCAGLGEDERFRDNPSRVAHRAALQSALEQATRRHTATELLQLLRLAGVPCAPVQDIAAVAADPQTAASDLLHHDDAGATFGLPLRFDGRRVPVEGGVPALGEHNADVM